MKKMKQIHGYINHKDDSYDVIKYIDDLNDLLI